MAVGNIAGIVGVTTPMERDVAYSHLEEVMATYGVVPLVGTGNAATNKSAGQIKRGVWTFHVEDRHNNGDELLSALPATVMLEGARFWGWRGKPVKAEIQIQFAGLNAEPMRALLTPTKFWQERQPGFGGGR